MTNKILSSNLELGIWKLDIPAAAAGLIHNTNTLDHAFLLEYQ